MRTGELKSYANLVAYPLAALVFTQFLNYWLYLGNVVMLIEVFTYSFIGFYSAKRFKADYLRIAAVAGSVAILYHMFVQSFAMAQGGTFSVMPIIYQAAGAVVISAVVAFITRRYMRR